MHNNPNGGKRRHPGLHRRRSSLPNLKLIPLTMAERRLLARQKRKDQEEFAKLAKQQQEEEKKQRAKQLRKATKAKDKKQRNRYSMRGGKVHCRFCDDMVDEIEFDDHKVSHPTQIRGRIWLGNAENSRDLLFIKKFGITHILNCTREIDLQKDISKKIKSFKRISIQDKNSETILDYINECNSFIESALGDSKFNIIFIHCREGRSRSVSFLCAYLMWKERISFYAALSDVTSKRHIVLPNSKFYHELEKFDKELLQDRQSHSTPKSKKFGMPNDEFILHKLMVNEINSQFAFPNEYTDDIKQNGADMVISNGNYNFIPSPQQFTSPDTSISALSMSPMNKAIFEHGRQRSSSLSALLQQSGGGLVTSTPKDIRSDIQRISSIYGGRGLSPIAGSPVGKKYRAYIDKTGSPWNDAFQHIDDKKKSNTKNNGSKKKKKKRVIGKKKNIMMMERMMDMI